MKYKNYGDNNKKYSKGTDLELLNVEDSVSARSINRPIINLYENQEETYKLLNTLLKTVYGNAGGGINESKAIIPDMYEEFAPDGFLINSFKSTDRYFLRIPTGTAILSKNNLKDKNDIYAYNETGYKDTNKESNYSKDKWKSFAYINRPNINLLERQLASFMDLNLDNSYNDIKVETEELPVTYLIYEIDPVTYLPILSSNGNIEHLEDVKGRALYICGEEEKADYYIAAGKINLEERNVKYEGEPKPNTDNIKKYYYFQDQINSETDLIEITDGVVVPPDATLLTYRLENAEYSIDFNGNPRKCIGYYLRVDETTATYKKTSFLPNKKEEAYVDLMFNDLGELSTTELEITFFDKETNVGVIPFSAKSNMLSKEVSESLVSSINAKDNPISNKLKIYAKLIKKSETKYGARIIFTDSFINNYDNYFVSDPLDSSKIKVNRAVRQEYYRNIFELTNEFLEKFKSDVVSTTLVPDFLNCETILKIDNTNKEENVDYYVYYNLTNKKEDKKVFDNSEKLFISTEPDLDIPSSSYMKLFKVSVAWNTDLINKSPKVKSVEYFLRRLDKRLIETKRAEFQTLSSALRTNLKGDFTATSLDRYVKILQGKEDNQIRIKSPVLRLSTSGTIEEKDSNSGTDFSKTFLEKDYIKGSEFDKRLYNSSKDTGIAIDSEKGIQIYDGTDSTEHVVELVSDNGKINLITNNESSEITLKNITDSTKNSINLSGLTKVSSKNDDQLTIEATDTLKSTTIQFKDATSALGNINFKRSDDSANVHNIITIDGTPVIDSTKETVTVKKNLNVKGITSYENDFNIKSGSSVFDLTENKGIISTVGSGKEITNKISTAIFSTLTKDSITNQVGEGNSTKINSDGTVENTATASITNTVKNGSIKNTVTTGSMINEASASITSQVKGNSIKINSDGTIENKSTASITNQVEGNSIKINSDGTIKNAATASITNTVTSGSIENTVTTGSIANEASTSITSQVEGNSIKINSDGNKIVTTSENITIDNDKLASNINIGNNTAGKKIIDIGNKVKDSKVSINAGTGGIGLTGTTTITGGTTITGDLTVETSKGAGTGKIKFGSGGSITATEYSGNAATATSWNSSRTITLGGDVSGTATSSDGAFTISVDVNKLSSTKDAGSDSKPVYFKDGVPVIIKSLNLGSESITGGTINGTTFKAGTTTSIIDKQITLGSAKISTDSTGNIKFSW